jgi:hypothetical protein
MADQLQLRGGTTTEHATFTGALREVTVDTDKDTVVVHDNVTVGGRPLLREDLSNLPAGTIDNADINASAAIEKTKISGTAITAADTGTVTSSMIADGTIVNADINASAAIAGTKISPDFGSQNVLTTGSVTASALIPSGSSVPTNGLYLAGANNPAISSNSIKRFDIDSSGYLSGNTNGLGNGRIPAMQYYRLNSDLTGSTATAPQSALGVRVTLVGNTVYEFESVYILTKTGTGTPSISLLFGLTNSLSLNNIGYVASTATSPGQIATTTAIVGVTVATSTQVVTSGREFVNIICKGTLSVDNGGDLEPLYQISPSPANAYAMKAGSFFSIWPLGADGANTSIGTWA